jgi:hypothetical protein
MADIMQTASEAGAKHDHLEIHSLVHGGYVVRQGRFDRAGDHDDDRRWMPRWEQAAFSTLAEALEWVRQNMRGGTP